MTLRQAISLVLLMGLSCALASAQQADSCLQRSIPVSVANGRGEPVPGLVASNFSAKMDGREVRITAAHYGTYSHRIVLLLDTSASMFDPQEKWDAARTAADAIAVATPQEDPLALLIFASQIEDTVDFAQGKAAVLAKVHALPKSGKALGKAPRYTALADAILGATKLLKPSQAGDVIFVVTDGWDNRSKEHEAPLREALESQGVRLFGVLLVEELPLPAPPTTVPTPRSNREYVQFLSDPQPFRDLAESSGGWAILLPVRHDLGYAMVRKEDLLRTVDGVHSACSQIDGSYRLDLVLPISPKKPAKWNLVVDTHGRKDGHLELHYPDRILPCVSPAP